MRLIHPFPSLLDAGATAAFVLLAGGAALTAAALAVAMFCLQASIGSTNDVVDAAADRQAKPAKPIPAGLVQRRTAIGVALVGGLAGLALAGLFGPAVLFVAIMGYGLGLGYDLRLKRTAWSWLAYALALPLVPAFAWLGAGAGLPPRFPILSALALLAGTALAVANGLVDLEGDEATGTAGLAGVLGRRRALAVIVACDSAVVALAAVTAWSPASPVSAAWLAVVLGAGVCATGARLSASRVDWHRRLGWELQAVAVALVAVGWFALQ
jgi:4-hydroxybenzoate polyprenyltransferase